MKILSNEFKTIVIAVLGLCLAVTLSAKDIRINFLATGCNTTFDSIVVLNQSKNLEVTVHGTSVLLLTDSAISNNVESNQVRLSYEVGDQIVFHAFAGKNSTIIVDSPKKSKAMVVQFVECVDIDGNHYAVVKIGTQTWMAENLRVTKYNNGDFISTMNTSDSWKTLNQGAQCSFNNTQNKDTIMKYGRLYNWFAVADHRKLAPKGWHVPTDKDFIVLETYVNYNLGNSMNTAKALASHSDWTKYRKPGTVGKEMERNNSSGFSAKPAGFRCNSNGKFLLMGDYGYFWSSTENIAVGAWVRGLDFRSELVVGGNGCKLHGYSVRCIQDNKKK